MNKKKRKIKATEVKRFVLLKDTIDYVNGGTNIAGIYEVQECDPATNEIFIHQKSVRNEETTHHVIGIDPNDPAWCHGKMAFELQDETLIVR